MIRRWLLSRRQRRLERELVAVRHELALARVERDVLAKQRDLQNQILAVVPGWCDKINYMHGLQSGASA